MDLLAIDLGGTKLAVAVVDEHGTIRAKAQEATSPNGPEAVADQVVTLSQQVFGGTQVAAIGAAVPAALDAPETDRVLWAPNLPGWRDIAFREMLEQRLGAPAFLELDGHAAAIGEWWVGAARGYRSCASIVIGTGIGAGFVIQGRLWEGRNRLAGAVGWMVLPGPTGLDHWENMAAGPGIVRRARQLLAIMPGSGLNPESLTARDVFAAARQGDAIARQVVEEIAETIGWGVANVISLANPEIVVLGGSVGQQGDLLLDTVRLTARQWAQPISAQDVPVVSSVLGEEAALIGAAYSALHRLTTSGELSDVRQ